MPLIFNGVGINLSMVNKASSLVKEKVNYLRENFSEDGKRLVIVWNDTQLNVPPMGHRIVDQSGNTIRNVDRFSPRGRFIPMYGEAVLWKHEGATEVVFTRRMPVMVDGKVEKVPFEKEVFTGKLTIDLDKQPDLAFFYYCVSTLLKDGENSDGTNMLKIRNKRKEDLQRIEQTRRVGKLQDNLLRSEAEGGISVLHLQMIAKDVRIGRGESMTEEGLRLAVYDRIVKNQRFNHLFKKIDEMMPDRVAVKEASKKVDYEQSVEDEILSTTSVDIDDEIEAMVTKIAPDTKKKVVRAKGKRGRKTGAKKKVVPKPLLKQEEYEDLLGEGEKQEYEDE